MATYVPVLLDIPEITAKKVSIGDSVMITFALNVISKESIILQFYESD